MFGGGGGSGATYLLEMAKEEEEDVVYVLWETTPGAVQIPTLHGSCLTGIPLPPHTSKNLTLISKNGSST